MQPEVTEKLEATVEPECAQQIGRRNVARIGERLARQQGAEKIAIGVADPLRTFRQIVHDIGRRQATLLQGQRKDERL